MSEKILVSDAVTLESMNKMSSDSKIEIKENGTNNIINDANKCGAAISADKESLLITPIAEQNMRWNNKNKDKSSGLISSNYENGTCDSISSIRNVSTSMNNTSTNVLYQTASPVKLVRQTSTPMQGSGQLAHPLRRSVSKPDSFDSISTSSCHMSAIGSFSSESDSSPPIREKYKFLF